MIPPPHAQHMEDAVNVDVSAGVSHVIRDVLVVVE